MMNQKNNYTEMNASQDIFKEGHNYKYKDVQSLLNSKYKVLYIVKRNKRTVWYKTSIYSLKQQRVQKTATGGEYFVNDYQECSASNPFSELDLM